MTITNNYKKIKSHEARWEQIKCLLRLHGFTLRGLASLYNVSPTCFISVAQKPYPKMEKIIAFHLGLNPWDLWPERYDENGKPNRINRWYLRGSRRKQDITIAKKRKTKKRQTARSV